MDAFTADYLSNLAAELSAPIIAKVAQRFQAKWQGDESSQALQRCLYAGVVGMVSKANLDVPDYEALLSDIFTDFFGSTAVSTELTRLVYLQPLSVPELEEAFSDAGYDSETLPGLDFPAAVAAFEAAFLEWAATEKALQPIIQVHQGWAQTDLQREMVALMRQMVAALQTLQPGQAVGIQADRIVAENVVSGTQQIIFQWSGGSGPLPPPTAWEKHYLRTLLGYCDPLDVAEVDELYAVDRNSAVVRVSDVYTSLYLARNTQPLYRSPGQPITAVEAVAGFRRLVILGYPGGGKSTLVNYLAAQLARRRLGQENLALPGWPDDAAPLPVRIILRHARPQEPDYRFTVTAQRMKGWLLAAMQAETQVAAVDRAAAGRVLGRLHLPDGRLLDDRPGVGVVERDGRKLPDIAWGQEVPAGTYTIGGGKQAYQSFDKRQVVIPHPYRLSRYPITYAQFQCFVEAEDFGDGRWWADMPEIVEDWSNKKYPVREIAEQVFPYASHPREMVSWYQAVAFCRWLGDKLGETVQLPHEYEWEVAARYPDGRAYPWGDRFDSEKANTDKSRIGQTTAVSLYPSGRNKALELYDLSGNVSGNGAATNTRTRTKKPLIRAGTGVSCAAVRARRSPGARRVSPSSPAPPRRRLRFSGGGCSSPISIVL
ncbi:MAG: SUMF1/EgtB/PvdO family nonheme iron enzyme [Anaerolineae bacterium]|nr:SUMF1/EgtB/PvdO family nonheme iron enzyme [Anaerolineae bacterium]